MLNAKADVIFLVRYCYYCLFIIMTETKDNIINRDELQASYINQVLDDMDIKDMMALLYDYMDVEFDKYSVDELIEEVEEYYPHLLND